MVAGGGVSDQQGTLRESPEPKTALNVEYCNVYGFLYLSQVG